MKLFPGWQRPAPEPDTDLNERSRGPDTGPVIVLVDGRGGDDDSLEWAAAEAAARGSELRIVYAFRWPRIPDPLGNATVDFQAREAAEALVTAAVRRARRIAPELRITTSVHPGRQFTALVSEARTSSNALVVLSHSRRFQRALVRRLARRTTSSVALIGLSANRSVGPSAGRVVVGVDADRGPAEALGFAFRAARRRGVGLTLVHVGRSVEDAVRVWRTVYPEVGVRWVLASGSVDSAVLAESAAAALTVVGADRHGQLRHAVRGSASYDVLRLARGPVVMVGTGSD